MRDREMLSRDCWTHMGCWLEELVEAVDAADDVGGRVEHEDLVRSEIH